ncbi:Sulfotransferase domain-containing protein [Limimonas halophila]|uniref:Sulfotransferase domain-containing protein n=1 Tax=Limimonas halophila TaxID=1082479 RepID=A0A1G7SQ87_9PROT|nr:sulfotransferase domain-containing protein [Limimonas halophila]SDG24589.1 Sulfotransferase domain-containing protein [Limimonas halophila]
MAGILWLSSYPKSGNTWLRSFLATYFRNPDEPLDINELHKFAYGDGFLVLYEAASGCSREELTSDDVSRLRPVMHRMLASHPQETVFVKTHSVVGFDDSGIPFITPDATAGAIYVVRNPLDVAVSLAHHLDVSFDQAVTFMCTKDQIMAGDPSVQLPGVVGTWTQHVESWLKAPGLKLHVMRYEDMQTKPGPTFRALVNFLQLPLHTKRLRKAIDFTSFDVLSRQEKQRGFNEARPDGSQQFFRRGQVGQWRETLTEDQVQRLIDTHAETMRTHGYLDKRGNPVF